MESSLPSGRLSRFAKLARLGLSTGTSLALSSDGKAAAELAAGMLSQMRGLAAKVGQMASYVDGMVPEHHREAYAAALGGLQTAAASSPWPLVREVVESELGGPVEALFEGFEQQPFASASIGQVHRARLTDGTRVAVKVQPPGVARWLASDLDNAGVVKSLGTSLLPSQVAVGGIFTELRARLEEELDYAREAAQTERFAAIFQGDPRIVIPRTFPERSSARVLTTDYFEGLTLDQMAERSEPEREVAAETLWRFVFTGLLVHKLFNADPHPGNYIFLPDGRVVFLDFGCSQDVLPRQNEIARGMHNAALDGDEQVFFEGVRAMLRTRGGAYEEQVLASVRRMFEPLFSPRFRMTRDYVASIIADMQGLKRLALDKKSGFVQMPEGMLFLNRLQFGFYSVLARLDAECSYRDVEEAILQRASLRA